MHLTFLKACNGTSFNISLDPYSQQQLEHVREYYRRKFGMQCSRATVIRRGLDLLANKAMEANPLVEQRALKKAADGIKVPLPELNEVPRYRR